MWHPSRSFLRVSLFYTGEQQEEVVGRLEDLSENDYEPDSDNDTDAIALKE